MHKRRETRKESLTLKSTKNKNIEEKLSITNCQIVEYNLILLESCILKLKNIFMNSIKDNKISINVHLCSTIKTNFCINKEYERFYMESINFINFLDEILPMLKISNFKLYTLMYKSNKQVRQAIIENQFLNDIIYKIFNHFCNLSTNDKVLEEIRNTVLLYKENIDYVFDTIKEYESIEFGYNLTKKDFNNFGLNRRHSIFNKTHHLLENEFQPTNLLVNYYEGTPIKKRRICRVDSEIIDDSFLIYIGLSDHSDIPNLNIEKDNILFDSLNNNESKSSLNLQNTLIDNISPFKVATEEIKSRINLSDKIRLRNLESQPKQSLSIINYTPENTNIVDSDLVYTTKEIKDFFHLLTINFSDLPSEVIKIAEASFSEVFKSKNNIYKIIPLGENYTKEETFLNEVFVLKTLSNENGVCKLIDAFFVVGKYTLTYLKAWDKFGFEENERPDKYEADQKYGLIVMEDCGIPLEKFRLRSVKHTILFLKDLLNILSNLEVKYEFEHRDLHWGNILIKDGKCKLIDFTLSRLKYKKILYNNLSTYDWLFKGDSNVDHQFEIYRHMQSESQNDWSKFIPMNNVHWFEYIIRKCFGRLNSRKSKKIFGILLEVLQKSKSINELKEKFNELALFN